MRNLPLASLRAFEAAARHESFVRAAADLNLQPAGISQHVKAMENWLRIPLFLRHSRGVTLTAAGREFGAVVTHALAHIEVAAGQLRLEANSRPVSVACIPSMAVRWLIPQLSRLRAAYPDIRINIVYALDAKTPEAAGADLLICHGIRPSAGAIKLLSAETRPTCSAEFLAHHGPFDKPADLLACDILHDETTDAWARWLSAVGIHSPPKAGPVFADFNLMIGSLISGQGVGLCPTALIADEIAAGLLISLFEKASDSDKGYWLIEAKGLSREARTLRDWLLTTGPGADGSIRARPAPE
ncbi:LysR family glycine cleavage system transcriptional activator [Rhizobium sp. BK650]|uniref:LysR substrate-binding domain-containing protein n=1 Tax=Rhizobium sp. BK650 TaxID=2586990 RepID=UPI00160F7FAF|nr:LysR substrate-binding domain-containing protein [Rhizobium sp. BK650]MBB3659043.1 LysR family glycine cleavage system transcriptional activator [Rhizobium sp. BK650]